MTSFLWKIRVKKKYGELAEGMTAEVIINGVSRQPSLNEIKTAFEKKYYIKVPAGVNVYEISKG